MATNTNDPSAPQGTSATPFPTSESAATASAGSAAEPAAPGSNGSAAGAQASSEDLLNRVVQSAHQTIDRLAESAAPHVRKLQDGVTGANEKLHEKADHAKQLGDEWSESLRSTVRDHPLAAVATALAVGMLIARLTR